MSGWIRGLLSAAVLSVLLVLAPGVQPSSVAGSASAAQQVTVGYKNASDRYESRIVHWTNLHRQRHGLKPLRALGCPDRFAESWARHLAVTGLFEHQDITRMFACAGVSMVGENLVKGNVSARKAVALWMRSPGHRANILTGQFTHIGVGSVYSVRGGTLVTVQSLVARR